MPSPRIKNAGQRKSRNIIHKEPQYPRAEGKKEEGSTITGEKAWPKGTDAELPKGACVAIASASELQGMGRVTMQRLSRTMMAHGPVFFPGRR